PPPRPDRQAPGNTGPATGWCPGPGKRYSIRLSWPCFLRLPRLTAAIRVSLGRVAHLLERFIGTTCRGFETLFERLHLLLRLLIVRSELEKGNERPIDDAAPQPHGPVEIEDQHHAFFVGAVPDLVLVGIVEDEGLPLTPDDDLILDAEPAVLGHSRNYNTDVAPQYSLGHTPVRRNVIARRKYREPGGLQVRNLLQQFRRYRCTAAVPFNLGAEAVQKEGSPIVSLGDVCLVA